MRGMLRFVEVI